MKFKQLQREKSQQSKPPSNDFHFFENALYTQGVSFIAGVDEAGRGCLAGPVVAAAVILPKDCHIAGLKDSKKLTPLQREKYFEEIASCAISYSWSSVGPQEIDEINILRASLQAMSQAVDGLSVAPEHLLIDGLFKIPHPLPQETIIEGDNLSHMISAASVVAKVMRDRMMVQFENEYPNFKFSSHKGYGTKLHLEELGKFGPTPIHRMTFKGVR